MANQITLAFSIATTSTIYSPAQAATKLAAVPLYANPTTDPVLGQAFGLTVSRDVVSTGGVTYTGEVGGPFLPGETVTDTPSGGTAEVALDDNGVLYFVAGTAAGVFAHGDIITGGVSGALATVNNAAALGGPTSTTPGATRVIVLNMTSEPGIPYAPPPFPCRPTGPLLPPPAGPPTLPYVLTETTINRYTRLPVTSPAPATVVAFYSTNTLDTDGVATTPMIPAGSGAQIMTLTYLDSNGGGPFTVHTKLMGKYPAVVTLGSIYPLAEITECFIEQVGAFGNSVGQITLCELKAALPPIPADATPADFYDGLTDAAQLEILRPLVYLPPSYFALSQQQNSAPQLAGDFWVKKDHPTVLTTVSQIGVIVGEALAGTVNVTHGDAEIVFSVAQTLPAGTGLVFAAQPDVAYVLASAIEAGTLGLLEIPYDGTSAAATTVTGSATIEFDAQPGVQYSVASVYATGIKLTTPYTGLTRPEIAPAAEKRRYAQSVSEEADAVVSSASLVAPHAAGGGPTQAAPPDSTHLTTLLAEFTLPQSTAPALTYIDEVGGPFTPSETVKGQKSGGSGTVLYDTKGIDESGLLAFVSGSVKSGFVKGETVTGQTSGATATVVVQSTLASNPLPTKLSGLYARTLSLVLGTPVVSQPMTLI